jgi:AcrR family transcriptional regulator
MGTPRLCYYAEDDLLNGNASMATDIRIQRSRAALRGALLGLLENQSFDQVTIRDISARAGTGYATFFRHYPDKQALLNDLAADEIRELHELTLPIVMADGTRAACLALCVYVNERRPLWSALLTGGASAALREEFLRQSRLQVPEGTDPRSWLPADLSVIFGVSGVLEILAWWLRDRRDLSIEKVAELLDRLVVAPAMSR